MNIGRPLSDNLLLQTQVNHTLAINQMSYLDLAPVSEDRIDNNIFIIIKITKKQIYLWT